MQSQGKIDDFIIDQHSHRGLISCKNVIASLVNDVRIRLDGLAFVYLPPRPLLPRFSFFTTPSNFPLSLQLLGLFCLDLFRRCLCS